MNVAHFLSKCKQKNMKKHRISVIFLLVFSVKLGNFKENDQACPQDFFANLSYINQLADYFQKNRVIIHLPEACFTTKIADHYGQLRKLLKLPNQMYYSVISQSNVSCKVSTHRLDLHVVSVGSNSSQYLKNCFDQRSFTSDQPWIWHLDSSKDSFLKSIHDINLDIDDDVIMTTSSSDKQSLHFWEVYRIGIGFPIEVLEFGTWNTISGSELSWEHKWYRRKDMKGYHLNFTTLEETPFITDFKPMMTSSSFSAKGSFQDLIDMMKAALNFTYTLRPPPDNQWGARESNGSWNGMIKLVQDKIVDIATTSLFQTKAREEVVSFSLPLQYAYQTVFIKNPSNAYNFTAYIEPLTHLSWMFIVLFLVVSPLALYSTALKKSDFSLGETYAASYMALLMLGFHKRPQSGSCKVSFTLISMCAALIYWHWEAMLVSYLAARKTVMPFKSLAEMYSKTDFRLALIPSTSYEDQFKYSSDPLWKSIYKERLEPYVTEYQQYPNHLTNMIHFIKDDYKTALYESFAAISTYEEYLNCTIVATKGSYFHIPYAWAFQKHSPYLELFNFHFQEMREKGSWKAIQKKYEPLSPKCPSLSGKPIEFANCFTAFLALVFGIAVGNLILFMEHFCIICRQWFINVKKGR